MSRRSLSIGFILLAAIFLVCTSAYVFYQTFLRLNSSGEEDSWAHFQAGGMFVTSAPSTCADGTALVYASPFTGHGDIYYMKQGQSNPVRLTTGLEFEASPCLSSDGKCIVFSREHNGRRHLWSMNVDGTHQRQVTDGNVLDDPLSFSSDNQYLLFQRSPVSSIGYGRSMQAHVLRIQAPASDPTPVGTWAVFRPDGRSVVFSDDGEDLWQLELDERYSRRKIGGRGWPLCFSSDGRFLLTGYRPQGASWTLDYEIWARDVEKNVETRIGSGHSAVVLGADPHHVIYFKGTDPTPYLTQTSGKALGRIAFPSGFKTAPRLVPGGRALLFASFLRSGSGDFDIVMFDSRTLSATTVASIRSDISIFQE